MTENEILSNLCNYDERNPDGAVTYMDKDDINEMNAKILESGICYCDNCFYGRTKLANELLRRMSKIAV